MAVLKVPALMPDALLVNCCHQIHVAGPWPFALLFQLYQCVRTLAGGILSVGFPQKKHVFVRCPHCHRTRTLSKMQTMAYKKATTPCMPDNNEPAETDENSDKDQPQSFEIPIEGFATWVSFRGAKTRTRVLCKAIDNANSASDGTVIHRVEHACHGLERCVGVVNAGGAQGLLTASTVVGFVNTVQAWA